MKPLFSDKVNELITQTIKNIKENENCFDMEDWALKINAHVTPLNFAEEIPENASALHSCGTYMCFAGWLLFTYRAINGVEATKELAVISYPMVRLSYPYMALRALEFDIDTAYEYCDLPWHNLRKNSADIANRICSVFMDKSIKTPEQLEERLIKYKLLRYDVQPVTET